MLRAFAVLSSGLMAAMTVSESFAQTCSCASVPILGAMESASPRDEQWFFAGTFEYHDLSALVNGSSTVPDATGRDRTSKALILELSRGLSQKWAVSVLMSAVTHERSIGSNANSASGPGDAVAMLKYSPRTISLYDKATASFGLGAQLPVGEDDATWQNVVLAEDMQPSTGAFGTIAWFYVARALNESRAARIYGSATFTNKGENDRDYKFGDSTTASIGYSHQTQSPWGYNVEFQYRHSDRDQRDSVDIPNTGGRWLHVIPAVQYHFTDSLALRSSAKIPVSRKLNDQLQFTTKFALRLSLSYVFGGE